MITRLISAILMVCAALSAVSAYALSAVEAYNAGNARFPDYGIARVEAEPGHTVLKVWNQTHRYFEETLQWTPDDFCNAFIVHNPQFSAFFTETSGCSNPGFGRLPVGETWHFPSPVIGYQGVAADANLIPVGVDNAGYTGIMFFERASAIAYITEFLGGLFSDNTTFNEHLAGVIQSSLPQGQEVIIASESELRARFSQEQTQMVDAESVQSEPVVVRADDELVATLTAANERLGNWVLGLGITSVVLALLAGFLFARSRSAQKEVTEEQTKRAIYENEKREAEKERGQIGRFKERMFRETVVPFQLPENLRRRDGEEYIYLPILKRSPVGEGREMLHVHLGDGRPAVLPRDLATGKVESLEKVYKRLTGDSEESLVSRTYFKVLLPDITPLSLSTSNGGSV